jgi:dolichol kinase
LLGFSWNDTLGIVLVYAYILFIFLIVEKAWKGDRAVGRKILHVSMGNIVFILWMFDHWWAEVLVAGSFLIFSLLITQRMQLYFLSRLTVGPGRDSLFKRIYRKIIARLSLISASDAGNEFGLVYYCLAYTALAFLFYKQPIVVAVGMLPLAYGDGLGAVIGRRFGKHPYQVIDRKSLEGSAAVLAATAVAVLAGMLFYGMPLSGALWKAALVGAVVAVVEGLAPNGLDNLAIPVAAVLLFLTMGA